MDQDALELLKIRLATLSAIKGMKVDEVLKKAAVAALDDTLTLVEIADRTGAGSRSGVAF